MVRHHRSSHHDSGKHSQSSSSRSGSGSGSRSHKRHRSTSRSRSRSRSPSRSSSPAPALRHESASDRTKRKEERKREKEMAKLLETPEEKMRRRREKKMKKHGFVGTSTAQLLGYTNESNPFGDSRLTEKFEWKKKKESDERKGELKRVGDDERRRERLRVEIQKARERRVEREAEKAEWEAEKERMAREAEIAEHEGWEEAEEEFQLEQERLRTDIRVEQGRAKPIDVLTKLLDDDTSVPLMTMEPYRIVEGCRLPELEDLMRDVLTKKAIGSHLDVWTALETVIADAIQCEKSGTGTVLGNVHGSIRKEVESVFVGKTPAQLDDLAISIKAKLLSGDAVDAQYWEDLLSQLKLYRARAVLDEAHVGMLERRLAALEKKGVVDDGESAVDRARELGLYGTVGTAGETAGETGAGGEGMGAGAGADDDEVGRTIIPELGLMDDIDGPGADMDLEVDLDELVGKAVSGASAGAGTGSSSAMLSKMERSAASAMARAGVEDGDTETVFAETVQLDGKAYKWSDKYRPRQPKYINRVATGFEWNKYNTSHYDHDNPPPRVVQGYKFNVFYPDLIDKSRTPRFYIDPCPGTDDFVIIRFHAGAPYEDVAFKVINREWEVGSRSGYRSEFKNGILSLYFRFKRYRYRR